MAGGNVPGFNRSYEASTDLTGSYFRAVNLDNNGQLQAVSANTDAVVGILQNKPNAQGQAGTVAVSGTVWIEAGTNLTAGSPVYLNADGTAGTTSTGNYLGVVEHDADSGKLAAVLVGSFPLAATA